MMAPSLGQGRIFLDCHGLGSNAWLMPSITALRATHQAARLDAQLGLTGAMQSCFAVCVLGNVRAAVAIVMPAGGQRTTGDGGQRKQRSKKDCAKAAAHRSPGKFAEDRVNPKARRVDGSVGDVRNEE